MHRTSHSSLRARRGFTLIELSVGSILLVLSGVAMSPILGGSRGFARDNTCKMNLKMQGQGYSAYAFTYGGQIASYSLLQGMVLESEWPELRGPFSNDGWASSAQQTDLLRRHTGRGDGPDVIENNIFTVPQRRFNHLILLDYLGLNTPQGFTACPQDANLLASQADPLNESLWGTIGPYNNVVQYAIHRVRQRYPFSTTYHTVPYAWVPEGRIGETPFVGPVESTSHLFQIINVGGIYGQRNLSEVAFPSLKVHVFEQNDFHRNAGDPFYAYDQAECNQLFFDGSVDDQRSSTAEAGWDPSNPDDPDTFYYRYTPLSTEPIPLGDPETLLPVRYRFTRGGLTGFDYLTRPGVDKAPDPMRR
jgi:type II secretory pathway pseudopilin PulG